MAKIRKFREGSTVEDAEEAKFKTAGLAASNAELERGERKPSGFLGLGRFLQGNIDQKGSEAYNLYGAGYGREVEAKNDRLKAATLKKAADDAARVAEDARSEARIKAADKKIAAIKERAATAESESDYRGPMERRKLDVSEPAKAAAPAASTGSGSGSGAPTKAPASTGSTSGSDYRGPMQRMKLDVSEPASGSGGGRGPTYDQVDANNRRGFTASPTSTDPAQRAAATAARAAAAAKAAADAPKVRNPETDEGEDVRPASQAQLRALAAIARATGSTSGVDSGRVPTAAEAARKITEYAKKAKNAASSFVDSFSNIETPPERSLRLRQEAKAKETASFNRESGNRATGGAIKSYAKGGSVSASRRGDGIAQRGKTRGRMF